LGRNIWRGEYLVRLCFFSCADAALCSSMPTLMETDMEPTRPPPPLEPHTVSQPLLALLPSRVRIISSSRARLTIITPYALHACIPSSLRCRLWRLQRHHRRCQLRCDLCSIIWTPDHCYPVSWRIHQHGFGQCHLDCHWKGCVSLSRLYASDIDVSFCS